MFSQLTYKQKTIMLIVSSIVVLVIGYQLAITPTLKLNSNIQKAKQNIELAKTAPNEISEANLLLEQLKRKVGQTSPSFEIFQMEVLNSIVPFADEHEIKINEIKLPHIATESNYEVQTLQIECKADFKELTLLLNHIQLENIGRVCSVNYELKKDLKLKKWFLFTTFYIQNYKAL